MALPPNLPFEQAAQIMRSRLMQYAREVRERGFPSAAEAMTDAAVLISNVVECHAGLVEREERLTAELVSLQKGQEEHMQSRCCGLRREALPLVVSALLIGTVIAILVIASRQSTHFCASSNPHIAWINGCE